GGKVRKRFIPFCCGCLIVWQNLFCLLPHERILIYHDQFIRLYKYSVIPLSVHQPEAIQPLNVNHLWEMSTSFMNRLTFSPFILPNGCVRVLFHNTESVFGVSFDDSDQEVRVTELLRFPPDLFGEFIQSPG